jgi:hypothetical protein
MLRCRGGAPSVPTALPPAEGEPSSGEPSLHGGAAAGVGGSCAREEYAADEGVVVDPGWDDADQAWEEETVMMEPADEQLGRNSADVASADNEIDEIERAKSADGASEEDDVQMNAGAEPDEAASSETEEGGEPGSPGSAAAAGAPEAADAPEADKADEPPPKPPSEMGRNRWHGLKLVEEEEAQPTKSMRSSFPLFAAGKSAHNLLVLGGGGGSSRSGVPNAMWLCHLTDAGECVRRSLH